MTTNNDLIARLTALEGAIVMLICAQAMQDHDILGEAKRLFKAARHAAEPAYDADGPLATAQEQLWDRIEALLTRPLSK